MWDALDDIARERGQTVHDVVAAIHRNHDQASLTSAIRVFIVEYYRARDRQLDGRHCDPEVVARDIVAALDRAGFTIAPRDCPVPTPIGEPSLLYQKLRGGRRRR